MLIMTRQERERLVLELYNQGKTIREIAKEVRMSFRDIGLILNKTSEDKETERSKEQQEEVAEHPPLSTQAYKLFSDRKTPLEVAIALNLGQPEVTKLYREYLKLKQLNNLNAVYEELGGNIEPLLRLYRLSKAEGMGINQVVNLLAIANNDLPAIEERFKRLRNDVSNAAISKTYIREKFIPIE
jgi:Mor family transcriptional regulator